MEPLYVEILMGHNLRITKSYFKPQQHELLEVNNKMRGYVSVINDLTINDDNRLKIENTNLNQTLAEWALNRQEMERL